MAKVTRIALVGAGKGGTMLLRALRNLATAEVAVMCDTSWDAPGMVVAREFGVATLTSLDAMLDRDDIDVIIEATGVEKVRGLIRARLRPDVGFIDSRVSRLFMDLTEAMDELQAKEAAAAAITEESRHLAEMAQKVNGTVQRFASSFAQIATKSKQIVQQQHALSDAAGAVFRALKESRQIVGFIQALAQETRILGLNASIEAARAGEKGLGFAVVASEVRGLAANSAANADKVSHALRDIEQAVTKVISGIEEASVTIASQEEVTTSASSWNDDLRIAAEDLARVSSNLTVIGAAQKR